MKEKTHKNINWGHDIFTRSKRKDRIIWVYIGQYVSAVEYFRGKTRHSSLASRLQACIFGLDLFT